MDGARGWSTSQVAPHCDADPDGHGQRRNHDPNSNSSSGALELDDVPNSTCLGWMCVPLEPSQAVHRWVVLVMRSCGSTEGKERADCSVDGVFLLVLRTVAKQECNDRESEMI